MGLEFMSWKAAQFSHGQDRAYLRRLAGETLYSRVREVASESFAAIPAVGTKAPSSGDHVVVVRNGSDLVVERGNEQIGCMDVTAVDRLRDFWSAVPDAGDLLEATVDEVSAITGEFSVRLGTEDPE